MNLEVPENSECPFQEVDGTEYDVEYLLGMIEELQVVNAYLIRQLAAYMRNGYQK